MLNYLQIQEAETARAIFHENVQLCNEINERVVQHYVRCIESQGRQVQYLKVLQTVVKAEGVCVRKCQDAVMSEVWKYFTCISNIDTLFCLRNTCFPIILK